ncbi:ubiquitin/ISG15-conjugating enzyme E2 L6 [Physeter macrocephalus]|uniref:E2 ubiquitin-conjugating enzyme n=1 Tax=Physeter macrocephalus TaxID=9755 RepID=A0A455C5V8_PHYMC|nr:ubiquitin/ISG15-conjugating enzyme E2 L6 [Physeter catodon]|eukprot:XP_028356720.1 ubiquitin/ISG15-conjugating enzyme E2 L6 [Physeter catodon]
MTASKRVAKELEGLQKELPRYLRNLFSDDANVLVWHALLLPEKPPYNLKAFNLRISFPEEYPFKPPTVTFTTRIYHPNVDSNGRVCLPIISKENWKPFTKTCQGGPGPCLEGGTWTGWGRGSWDRFSVGEAQNKGDKNCESQLSLSSDRRDAS